MKTPRSQNDICLLCQINKSDKKGSHYTPAGLIKREIGRRDFEELYSINPSQATTSVFLGRSNLNNTDTTIRQGQHVEDYIFCTPCEKQLAVIESACNEKLLQLSDALLRGKLEVENTKLGNKYVSLTSINRNVFILYFYSVIWRQCLQQKILHQTNFLADSLYEKLRQIIHTEIYRNLKEIAQSEEFGNYPSLIILTTYHRGDRTKNFTNPNPVNANPEVFFTGPFNALLFKEHKASAGFEAKTGLPATVIDSDLVVNQAETSKIGVTDEHIWSKATNRFLQYVAERYLYVITTRLAKTIGVPFRHAGHLLNSTAQKFLSRHPDEYTKCLELAFEVLTGKRYKP